MVEKRRVALLCEKNLLGESLEYTLQRLPEVEFVARWSLTDPAAAQLSEQALDLLLIGEEELFSEEIAHLTARIIEECPDLPVIRITLEQNTLRIYTSQACPARSAELIEIIRKLPVRHTGNIG